MEVRTNCRPTSFSICTRKTTANTLQCYKYHLTLLQYYKKFLIRIDRIRTFSLRKTMTNFRLCYGLFNTTSFALRDDNIKKSNS